MTKRSAKRSAGHPALGKGLTLEDFTSRVRRSFITMGTESTEDMFKKAHRASTDSESTLIVGETGTGKELIAHTIHEHGDRRGGPFVEVNCAELTERDVQQKMFGVKARAFTDVKAGSKGRLREANGGTIFLDEVHRIPVAGRDALLRVLETGRVISHGADSSESEKLDVRLISATNADIGDPKVLEEDFLARISTHVVKIPPLPMRKWDILLLLIHFLDRYSSPDKRLEEIDSRVVDFLVSYRWPRNVRELRDLAVHLAAEFRSPCIRYEDLFTYFRNRGWDHAAYTRVVARHRSEKGALPEFDPPVAQIAEQGLEIAYGSPDLLEFNEFGRGRNQFYVVKSDTPEEELPSFFPKPYEPVSPSDANWFSARYSRERHHSYDGYQFCRKSMIGDYHLMREHLLKMYQVHGGELSSQSGPDRLSVVENDNRSVITKSDFERSIAATFRRTGGNISETARIHGVGRDYVRNNSAKK